MVVLTALAVVSGIAVPPIVDRLRERAARQTEHQLLLAQRQEGAAAERAEQLRSHFRPRGRGVLPSSLREGSYFAGRVQVLSELTAWINTEGSDTTRSRVVTGAPGSGKSAVLGRLVSLADAQLRGETPIALDQALPQIGALCAAVHVRGRTVDEVAAEISRARNIDESTAGGLLAHLRETREHRATVVVVDGVDEAADAQRLIVDLLEPLAAASGRTGIRLLVGTRPGGEDDLLRLFGGSARVIDLDEACYLDRRDIAEYVRLTMLAESDPQIPTPYRSHPELATSVGAAVAVRSGRSFLVAQLTALSLMAASEPVDTNSAGWQETFPTTVGAAMERYLHDVQPGGPWLRDLLMALAWSQGDGFDDPRTWAAAATALGTDTYSERDVTRLLLDTTAIDLLHRTERGSGVRFRLFHEALGEHLRQLSARQRPPAEIHRRLTEVLLEHLSPTSAEGLLWADADAYTRTYLPFHAAEGQVLDRLLRDARFLATMDPARLLAALPAASTPSGRRAARTVQRVGQQLLMASEDERVCYLEMAARMAGDEELAASLAAAFPDRPWAVRWAHWDDLVATRMLGHHDDYVLALATVEHPRGAVVLSASAWAVQAWFLRDGAPLASGVHEPESAIVDMTAFMQSDDGIAVITLHKDGRLLRTVPDATDGQVVLADQRALHGVWPVVIGGRRRSRDRQRGGRHPDSVRRARRVVGSSPHCSRRTGTSTRGGQCGRSMSSRGYHGGVRTQHVGRAVRPADRRAVQSQRGDIRLARRPAYLDGFDRGGGGRTSSASWDTGRPGDRMGSGARDDNRRSVSRWSRRVLHSHRRSSQRSVVLGRLERGCFHSPIRTGGNKATCHSRRRRGVHGSV